MADKYELYLIRHGVAEARGDEWPDDAKRPLTESGMARMRKAARGLVNLGVSLDVVVTSPLVRAKQTAEIVASAFDLRPPIITTEALTPGAAQQALQGDLDKLSRRRRLALVGHEPGIGELAARLSGSRRVIVFKKGAVCRIDIDALQLSSPGTLRWFLTPRILRSIRK